MKMKYKRLIISSLKNYLKKRFVQNRSLKRVREVSLKKPPKFTG